LVANQHHAIVTESRDLAADFLKKTQARYEGGTVAKLDVIRAQVALAQAETDLIGTARDIQTASDALDRLIGQAIGTPIAPRDSLEVPPLIPDVDLLEQQALAARPELASLASQQAGARANTTLAREFWLPDFTLGAQRDYAAGGGGALYTAGIALPVPLFYWQHTKGEIAESQHHERELAASLRDLRAQVSQEVRAAYATAAAALRQAVYLRDALLPSAREAYRVASVSYGLGGSSALDVLDARRNLLDAELQYADALAAANSSRADLERAVAAPLSNFDARKAP
jgi:outer membrane protein TolC